MNLFYKIFFCTIVLTSISSQAHHYKGEIEASNEFINHHKQWAKEYHGMSDKKRFLNNLKKFTGKSDVKIKPKLLMVDGMKTKSSLKSYKKRGEMGIVKGAPEHAFRGKVERPPTLASISVKRISPARFRNGLGDRKR